MRPNILLITIDCWRFDRLGKRTKNLQNLASKGVSFKQAYTGGGWTQAAFPALLSSTYGSMYEGCLGTLSEERPYLPQWLQNRGYQTLAVQTSPLLDEAFGYGRGINELVGLQPPWQAPSWYGIKGMQRLLRRETFQRITRAANIRSRPAPAYANAEEATNRAMALLHRTDKPFFLWVHYMDAHWPYYDQEGHDTPQQLAQSWTDRQEGHLAVRQKNRQRPPAETVAHWVKMHDAAIQTIDQQIGRLLITVEQKVGEDVLTIVTGDHGEEFYEHGNFGHSVGSHHEEILHVPLIAVYPKHFSAKIIQQPVSLLDIAPTITDLLESEVPVRMLGHSLLPLISANGAAEIERRPIIADSYWGKEAHVIAIRSDDYKFIINLAKPDNWQLFDLHADPEEEKNLRPDIPDDAPDFWALLDQHLVTVKASKKSAAESPNADKNLLLRMRDLGYLD